MNKLLEPEGGRPNLTIDVQGGEVVVQFDRPCQWIGLSPDNAIELSYALYEKARKAGARGRGESVILLPPG